MSRPKVPAIAVAHLRLADAQVSMDKNYARVLDVLRSVPRHPDVTPIEPTGNQQFSFFPGQQGYDGAVFPVGGIMLVANNFDNFSGWASWSTTIGARDNSLTFKRLIDVIVPAAKLAREDLWLTNYSLGVMDVPTSQYEFPPEVRKHLRLAEKFAQFVDIMRPRLIVAMGGAAQKYIGIRRGPVVNMLETNAIAIWHPSARYKSRTNFISEGERIRAALES